MVTMAEDFGVADRGSFYDAVGTLRDVVQNHLLQVIGLIAMEAPVETLTQPRIDLFKTIPDANPGSVVRGGNTTDTWTSTALRQSRTPKPSWP